MMISDTQINRTGVATAPEEAEKTAEGAARAKPSASGNATALAQAREPYITEGEPVGSRPPSAGPEAPEVFMDKLGDRLAFERSGTRLYQTLLGKMKANGTPPGGPSMADIEHIMMEEHRHFQLVSAAIEQVGGDPTVETPMADLTGVASSGLVQVLTDPRTTVPQCLHALLTAELTDNDGWEMLINLAGSLGHEDMVTEFQKALESEKEHLEKVRGWISTLTEKEAGKVSAKPSKNGRVESKTSNGAAKSAAKKASTDAITLLKDDHKKVKALFREFEQATSSSAMQAIVEQVAAELRIHTSIEEEIFYPAYREKATKKGEELVAESFEEHHVADALLEELRTLNPSDEQYEAKVTVLIENVEHHIEEEEKEMFPDAKKRLGKATTELGEKMEARKNSLMVGAKT